MGLLSFVTGAMARKMESIATRADQAGKEGVEVARSECPVVTGQLRDSIGYTWRQSDMQLSLYADAPYAWWVSRRSNFMRAGAAAMSRTFTGKVSTQFTNLPEKYQRSAKLLAGNSGHIIIGHRRVRRTR